MTERHDWEWWAARLDVAREENSSVGSRSAFFGCPACGSSDNLHLTETATRVVAHCFSPGCTYAELLEAVSEDDTDDDDLHNTPHNTEVRLPKVTFIRGREARPAETPVAEVGTGSSTLPLLHQAAQRAGMTVEELKELGLPMTDDGTAIIFLHAAGVKKRRGL